MAELKTVLAERGARYGAFKDNADISTKLKAVIDKNAFGLRAPHREALYIICQKISRILCGDPEYIDNWRDIAGYAELICRMIEIESSVDK